MLQKFCDIHKHKELFFSNIEKGGNGRQTIVVDKTKNSFLNLIIFFVYHHN
jgi:hypothetical protein